MALNKNLGLARINENDEFYTQLSDIENELRHYKHHFKNKVVYCNCDDPRLSNFFHYFSYNFEHLGLKKLITTCYQNQERDLFSQHDSKQSIKLEYTGETNGEKVPKIESIGIEYLEGDGDFRSEECIGFLKEADIVVTNPPFSLFREFIDQLIEYNKKFVVIGNMNSLTYKEIFPLLRKNKMWLGYKSGDMSFKVPEHYEPKKVRYWEDEKGQKWRSLGNITWYTNLDIDKRHEDIILYKRYNKEDYLKFDNYDAINVDKVTDIPEDYDGVMGVPITFMNKHNPNQFEIIDANEIRVSDEVPFKSHGLIKDKESSVEGKAKYVRIPIRKVRS